MRSLLFSLSFICFLHCCVFAQTDTLSNINKSIRIKNIETLTDEGYEIDQIVSDTTLSFNGTDSVIQYSRSAIYWYKYKIYNPSHYAQSCYLSAFPDLDNTLYFYNKDTKKWQTERAGLAVPSLQRRYSLLPCTLQARQWNTVFVKVNLTRLGKNVPIEVAAYIQNAENVHQKENYLNLIWITTLSILLLFFLYNLYLYFAFRDTTYLHYFIILVGGVIYITSLNHYWNILLPFRVFQVDLQQRKYLYFFDMNSLLLQVGILTVMTGFFQLTRSYLQTKSLLPRWDNILKYGNISFVIFFFLEALITISGLWYIDNYLSLFQNILLILIILLMLYMGVLSHRNGFKAARYFLLANTVPLIFMLLIAGYFALYRFYGNGVSLLPSLALISQALTFAVALVARINLIKEELRVKELEAQTLRAEYEQIQLRHQVVMLENEKVGAEMILEREQKLQAQNLLEHKQRELTSSTIYLYQKNAMLNTLQQQIEKLPASTAYNKHVQDIKAAIQDNLYLANDWEKFKLHFEEVHPNFFQELKIKYPSLTAYEMRLCAYYQMQLSVKEIAALLNISPNSVHRAKSRLNKKMNILESNTDIEE